MSFNSFSNPGKKLPPVCSVEQAGGTFLGLDSVRRGVGLIGLHINALYKSEFAEVLEDCTPSEIDSILKIVKEVKRSMHSQKSNKDY